MPQMNLWFKEKKNKKRKLLSIKALTNLFFQTSYQINLFYLNLPDSPPHTIPCPKEQFLSLLLKGKVSSIHSTKLPPQS